LSRAARSRNEPLFYTTRTRALEVFDDVALDRDVWTGRDGRPIIVVVVVLVLLLLLRLLRLLVVRVMLVMMVMMVMVVRRRGVRPSLGQQFLENRQYGDVQ